MARPRGGRPRARALGPGSTATAGPKDTLSLHARASHVCSRRCGAGPWPGWDRGDAGGSRRHRVPTRDLISLLLPTPEDTPGVPEGWASLVTAGTPPSPQAA